MSRLFFVTLLALALCGASAFGEQAGGSTNVLAHVERTIIKEPKYESSPRYSLLLLSSRDDVKVWMVEDGKRLFVDKNANGDLTDDGLPIQPSKLRSISANRWDFNYLLDAITPTNGSRHTSFDLRRWNYGEKEDNYGLSLSVDGERPMYAGWFGTFWSAQRETAPVIHFGGQFTPKLLRFKEIVLGSGRQRFSVAFINPGSDPGAESRLSIDAYPSYLVPAVNIEWPTSVGAPPLRTSYRLNERCCYWEFYTTAFEVPKGAAVGRAKVSVDLPTVRPPIVLTTTNLEVPVVTKLKPADSTR